MAKSRLSKQKDDRSFLLVLIDWSGSKLVKSEFEFATLEEAVEASKSKVGKIKIYTQDGRLITTFHNTPKIDRPKTPRADHHPHHHHNHPHNHHHDDDDDDDDSYA